MEVGGVEWDEEKVFGVLKNKILLSQKNIILLINRKQFAINIVVNN